MRYTSTIKTYRREISKSKICSTMSTELVDVEECTNVKINENKEKSSMRKNFSRSFYTYPESRNCRTKYRRSLVARTVRWLARSNQIGFRYSNEGGGKYPLPFHFLLSQSSYNILSYFSTSNSTVQSVSFYLTKLFFTLLILRGSERGIRNLQEPFTEQQ